MSNPFDATTNITTSTSAAAASVPPVAAVTPPLSTPSLDVSGRIFLITGGTQGLGLEIASQLKQNGAAAIVLVSRSPDKFQSALDRLNDEDATPSSTAQRSNQCIIKFIRADLSNANDASSIIPRAIQLLSTSTSKSTTSTSPLPQPILISGIVNAAASTSRGNLLTTTPEMFDDQYTTNVRGPFLVTQGAARHMMDYNNQLSLSRNNISDSSNSASGSMDGSDSSIIPRGLCSIVNICSVAAKGGAPFILPYSCAKSALVTLTKNNAAELAPHGIRVNGVNMGWCLTENEHALQREVHGGGADEGGEGWWRAADAGVPLGRILRPADVAASVVFLLSGASVMMTGSILDLHPEYPCGMLSLATEDTPQR